MVIEITAGHVYMMDYNDLQPAGNEMVKKRMVVAVSSRRLNKQSGLVVVVPLSLTPPKYKKRHNVPISNHYKWIRGNRQLWAKCDILHSVCPERLSRLWDDNDGNPVDSNLYLNSEHQKKQQKKKGPLRRILTRNTPPPNPRLSRKDLKHIRIAVAHVVELDAMIDKAVKREFMKYQRRRYRFLLPRLRGAWES